MFLVWMKGCCTACLQVFCSLCSEKNIWHFFRNEGPVVPCTELERACINLFSFDNASGVGVIWATDNLTLFSCLNNSIPQLRHFAAVSVDSQWHSQHASQPCDSLRSLQDGVKRKYSCKVYKGQKQIWKVRGTCPHCYHPSTPNMKEKVEKSIFGVKYIYFFLVVGRLK